MEIEQIKNQISQPSTVTLDDNVYSCSSALSLTMTDGKICNWQAPSSSQNSHSKPRSMNDLEAMKTKQIVVENVKLGISSLHAWIKCFEGLLQISYRLDIKKLSVWKVDSSVVDAGIKEMQGKFRRQLELLVDAPKPGFGTTNDGNTARVFE
ncbi:uncharacterized protein TNCT_258051 [Trichonephila clavata]|uniref:Uncharacterized protein n=1 Tax=Trichonephila clavata TaxID=2740835 RepID=A0A8X6HPE2_TRICU|nr:uncharacterized protein TNCT_258051 [Trichonephila clavata]